VKTFTIGEKQPEPTPDKSRGPGTYSPEKADSAVKHRNKSAFIGGPTHSSPSRNQDDAIRGPGAYDVKIPEANSFTIGERRSERRPDKSPAPGTYNADQSIETTKYKGPSAFIAASPNSPTRFKT